MDKKCFVFGVNRQSDLPAVQGNAGVCGKRLIQRELTGRTDEVR